MVDCLITGAMVADGTGVPLIKANVAMDAGRIAVLQPAERPPADRVLAADGMVVAPGFIDIHSHNDLVAVCDAHLNDKVSQGVTTEVFGNCGFSPFPVTSENGHLLEQLTSLILPGKMTFPDDRKWGGWRQFAEAIKAAGCQANVVGQVGHIMLRSAIMGMSLRTPTDGEIEAMQALLSRCLDEGASGLSFGLMYHPSSYAEPREIRALCKVAAEHGALVSVHLRGYDGKTLISSMNELIEAAEATGASLQLSHLAPTGADAQQLTELMLDAVDAAASRGLDVSLDRYPYEKGMSRLGLIFPKWVAADSTDAMLERLADPAALQRMIPEVDAFVAHIGYDHIAFVRDCDPSFIGKTVARVASKLGLAPAAAAAKVMLDSAGLAGIVLTLSTMTTQERVIKHCLCMVGSDGIPSLHGTHPRTFGTFARVLGPFVRKGVLSLPEAIRKMTSLPADRLGLKERGRVADGYVADLAVFNPATVGDTSTFADPYAKSSGIVEVFVAGQPVYRNGQILDVTPGEVLTCRAQPR